MATLTGIKDYHYGLEKIFPEAQDFLPLLGTDYVELYVGNAKQAAHYYKTAFGFQSLAYAGLETGLRDRTSYVLKQGKIRLVLTTPLSSHSPHHRLWRMAEHERAETRDEIDERVAVDVPQDVAFSMGEHDGPLVFTAALFACFAPRVEGGALDGREAGRKLS